MPRITMDGQSVDVSLNEPLDDACEELGVDFACRAGACGTCEVVVLSGLELLIPRTEEEETLDLPDSHRLCCQIEMARDGVVEIEEA